MYERAWRVRLLLCKHVGSMESLRLEKVGMKCVHVIGHCCVVLAIRVGHGKRRLQAEAHIWCVQISSLIMKGVAHCSGWGRCESFGMLNGKSSEGKRIRVQHRRGKPPLVRFAQARVLFFTLILIT